MGWIKHIKLKFKHMIQMSKNIEMDSKFIVIIFLICLIPICISSFGTEMSLQGNMITIRTMFSSLLGYIIENMSSKKKQDNNISNKRNIGFDVNEVTSKEGSKNKEMACKQQTENIQYKKEVEQIKQHKDMVKTNDKNKLMLDVRTLIIGHILLIIAITLIIGTIINVDQSNHSLILLKNTAFACIGFLISATKTNQQKQK